MFWAKKFNTEQQQQQEHHQQHKTSKHKNSSPEPGIEHGTSRIAVWCVTLWPPCQLKVAIEDKLKHIFNDVVFL